MEIEILNILAINGCKLNCITILYYYIIYQLINK